VIDASVLLTAFSADAAYVALAELPGGPLITCDTKLAGASRARCSFDLIR
jgi:predicted nucleic acid-binding protein